jgi:selenocysteine-specific elongation factor
MNEGTRQFIIGMAGHIDHGKTALVKALTGIDTDRLEEEKKRGITIDLGFAHLTGNITIIDVPGHEKLIKNMVAGVSTIDLVLFVIAADDGIMPQTREHLDIINLLGIHDGIFVITKTDLAEQEWIDLVEEEVRELLHETGFRNAPILRVSVITGEGIPRLKKLLLEKTAAAKRRLDDGIFRLPVDRAFIKAGFGSIVTGSVIAGSVKTGEMVEILPHRIQVRVRGLQSHDNPVNEVRAGDRAAINLAGSGVEVLHRGEVIAVPGFYEPVDSFNANLTVLPDAPAPVKNRMRIRIHLHTAEIIGRLILLENRELQPGENGLVQIRLEEPAFACYDDRFIIRRFSPQHTLGGGRVLQTNPPRFRKRFASRIVHSLHDLQGSDPDKKIMACFSLLDISPMTQTRLQVNTAIRVTDLEKIIRKLSDEKKLLPFSHGKETHYYSSKQISLVLDFLKSELERYHKTYPGRTGMAVAELFSQLAKYYSEELINNALTYGVNEGTVRVADELVSLSNFRVHYSQKEEDIISRIENIYLSAEFQPPLTKDLPEMATVSEREIREYLKILKEQNKLVLVEDKLFFHTCAIEKLVGMVRNFYKNRQEMTVSDLKDLLGITRKYAIPLLSYLDDRKFTERAGDVRHAGPRLQNKD